MGFLFPSPPEAEPLVIPDESDTLEPLQLEATEVARRRAILERRRRGTPSLIVDPVFGEMKELEL